MYLHGKTINIHGETIEVRILTDGIRTPDIEIGDPEAGVYFTASSPVEVEASVNDTFDVAFRQSARIRLLTKTFLSDIFRNSCRDSVVNIFRDGTCVFAGFIEPQTYSQQFVSLQDELEINCIDALSALQFARYRDVGVLGIDYGIMKRQAGMRTLHEILSEIINGITSGLCITGEGGDPTATQRVFYDRSVSPDSYSDPGKLFHRISVSDLPFFGSDEDDILTQDVILESMLRYLNLHICQEGADFYIFSLDTLKRLDAVRWMDLTSDNWKNEKIKEIEISLDNADGCDTRIGIGQVYNLVSVTCPLATVDEVVKSPLDENDMTSPYTNKQLYYTELTLPATGNFNDMVAGIESLRKDKGCDVDGAAKRAAFMRVMQSDGWKFYGPSKMDLYKKYCQGNVDQQRLLQYMGYAKGACLIQYGVSSFHVKSDDNSLPKPPSMETAMIFSVCGTRSDTESAVESLADSLQRSCPMAEYVGPATGTVFSPADNDTVNYIVISGKMSLVPAIGNPLTWSRYRNDINGLTGKESIDGKEGKIYYLRIPYECATPSSEPIASATDAVGIQNPFLLPSDSLPELFPFNYSAEGDSTDKISKVPVLACMLVIGNKCLVETGKDGNISDFKWLDYKERIKCADDDEYYAQSFTLGFDPKIGDKIIGPEYEIRNNVPYTLGIEETGTAIAIRKSDRLRGEVKFQILGPVNTIWDDITRRHPTWFRHTKWTTTSKSVLQHTSGIVVKEFNIKAVSDNGNISELRDNELTYTSDTSDSFINKMEGIEFRISSALTLSECEEVGITNSISLSTACDTESGLGMTDVYDCISKESARPEKRYVDSYYREYSSPRILMEQSLQDFGAGISRFARYIHPAMPERKMFVEGISRDLYGGTARLSLKEIDSI